MVLRSDRGITPEGFAAANPRYTPRLSRLLLPPHASPAMAEFHGSLDDLHDEDAFALVRRTAGGEPLPDPAGGGVAAFVVPEPGGLAAPLVSRDWPLTWPEYGSKTVALRTGVGDELPVAWEEDSLAVRLAPAAQVTLELSTYVRSGFLDHFAAKALLPVGGAGDGTAEAVDSGRHPLLTPPVTVPFVHAVRRPLFDPAGSLSPARTPGATLARLEPMPLQLGVNPDSTIRVEVTASWTEHDDDQVREIVGAPVDSSPVARGADDLAEPLIHELDDTRHRTVTYTVTAASRFRQYFHVDEDPASFIAAIPLRAVSVPSTARPAPLQVLSVRPAFIWDEERVPDGSRTVRRRGSRTLRVEVARPWFDSGAGEQLAVLVAPGAGPEPRVWPSITQLGKDPIRTTAAPGRFPGADAFPLATDAPQHVLLEDGTTGLLAVPHDVWFGGECWYCDVELADSALARSYCPFVQLAVARFQQDSLTGLELSRVVRCEMVTLLPDRTLTVTRSAAGIDVLLEGLGPDGPSPNRVDVVLERFDGLAEIAADDALTATGPNPRGVPVWLPVSSAALASAKEELARRIVYADVVSL